MVAITDNGTSMTPEVVQAFDPFFTTQDIGHGTGLGLSQVYGFMKRSRGHVRIYSEVGWETTVKLYLPPRGPARKAALCGALGRVRLEAGGAGVFGR